MKLTAGLMPQSESPADGVQLSPSPDATLRIDLMHGTTNTSKASTKVPASGPTTLQFGFSDPMLSDKLLLPKKPESNVVPRFPSGAMLNTTDDVLHRLFGNDGNVRTRTPDFSNQHIDESVPLSIKLLFSSSYLSQEYNVLGDIVLQSKPASPSPSNSSILDAMNIDQSSDHLSFGSPAFPPASALSHSSSIGPSQLSHTSNLLAPPISQAAADRGSRSHRKQNERIKQSRPFISLGTVADSPEEHSSPSYTHNMHLAVREIYSGASVSFDYPESYHLLTKFLKTRFLGHGLSPDLRQQKRQSLIQILKLIASYRPTFISAHKLLLKPTDLQFLEMCLQRSLLDYQRLCYLNSSPTIIWRRTGEIVSITSDLLSILGYEMKDLIDNRTFIVELMHDDESIINYYRLFKSVAVGNLHLTIFTQCKLSKKPDWCGLANKDHIDFCSVWTVKRDLYDLPMLIIGLFLPVLHN